MRDCNWMRQRKAERLTIRAFLQAMAEAGIPKHPGGQCPSADCRCLELADQIEARAVQIAEEKLGRSLPDVAP